MPVSPPLHRIRRCEHRIGRLGRWTALLAWVTSLLAISDTQAQPTYTTAFCGTEFAAHYPGVEESGSECLVRWDADLAPRLPDGGYRLVWEELREGSGNPPALLFKAMYERKFGTSSLECTLGVGANPEVFGDVVTWFDHQSPTEGVKLIGVETIEKTTTNGGCLNLQTGVCDCQSVSGAAKNIMLEDPNGIRSFLGAVTDGQVVVWSGCTNGVCTAMGADNSTLFACKIERDANGVPTGCGENNPDKITTLIPELPNPGDFQRRARVTKVDDNTSFVVYEKCPPGTSGLECLDQAGVGAIKLDLRGTLQDPLKPAVVAQFEIVPATPDLHLPSNWPDVEGDLVVWSRDGVMGAGPEHRDDDMWGCRLAPDFESCGTPFQITDAPRNQFRGTVFGNMVAWSDSRHAVDWQTCGMQPPLPQDKDCSSHSNIYAGILIRDAVTGDIELWPGTHRAVLAEARVTDEEPVRQRGVRAAADALIWEDTRHSGCAYDSADYDYFCVGGTIEDPTPWCQDLGVCCAKSPGTECCGQPGWECWRDTYPVWFSNRCCLNRPSNVGFNLAGIATHYCDDSIGTRDVALVPLVGNEECFVEDDGRVRFEVDLQNTHTSTLQGPLHDRITCWKRVNGVDVSCGTHSADNFCSSNFTLAVGNTHRTLDWEDAQSCAPSDPTMCDCDGVPPEDVYVEYQLVDFTAASPNECGGIATYTSPQRIQCSPAWQGGGSCPPEGCHEIEIP